MNFLETHQQGMETLGFWTEDYRKTTMKIMELQYKTEIIKEWCIVDFVSNGDKVLVKWAKRFIPLSEQELKEEYGR